MKIKGLFPDHWKGIPIAAIWHVSETVDFGEGGKWTPGESAVVPYGYAPGVAVPCEVKGFMYSHGQIEGFLYNQLNENFVPRVEEFSRWIDQCERALTASSPSMGRPTTL